MLFAYGSEAGVRRLSTCPASCASPSPHPRSRFSFFSFAITFFYGHLHPTSPFWISPQQSFPRSLLPGSRSGLSHVQLPKVVFFLSGSECTLGDEMATQNGQSRDVAWQIVANRDDRARRLSRPCDPSAPLRPGTDRVPLFECALFAGWLADVNTRRGARLALVLLASIAG